MTFLKIDMKRVRIRRKSVEKILSCSGMNIIKYAVFMLCLAVMCNYGNDKRASDSWSVYCKKYNVNPNATTVAQEIFYLDCYVGSVEEEQDLN